MREDASQITHGQTVNMINSSSILHARVLIVDDMEVNVTLLETRPIHRALQPFCPGGVTTPWVVSPFELAPV